MNRKKEKTALAMKPGIAQAVETAGAEINLVVGDRLAYLWVGNQSTCYATLDGDINLRKLAKAILAEVGEDHDGR